MNLSSSQANSSFFGDKLISEEGTKRKISFNENENLKNQIEFDNQQSETSQNDSINLISTNENPNFPNNFHQNANNFINEKEKSTQKLEAILDYKSFMMMINQINEKKDEIFGLLDKIDQKLAKYEDNKNVEALKDIREKILLIHWSSIALSDQLDSLDKDFKESLKHQMNDEDFVNMVFETISNIKNDLIFVQNRIQETIPRTGGLDHPGELNNDNDKTLNFHIQNIIDNLDLLTELGINKESFLNQNLTEEELNDLLTQPQINNLNINDSSLENNEISVDPEEIRRIALEEEEKSKFEQFGKYNLTEINSIIAENSLTNSIRSLKALGDSSQSQSEFEDCMTKLYLDSFTNMDQETYNHSPLGKKIGSSGIKSRLISQRKNINNTSYLDGLSGSSKTLTENLMKDKSKRLLKKADNNDMTENSQTVSNNQSIILEKSGITTEQETTVAQIQSSNKSNSPSMVENEESDKMINQIESSTTKDSKRDQDLNSINATKEQNKSNDEENINHLFHKLSINLTSKSHLTISPSLYMEFFESNDNNNQKSDEEYHLHFETTQELNSPKLVERNNISLNINNLITAETKLMKNHDQNPNLKSMHLSPVTNNTHNIQNYAENSDKLEIAPPSVPRTQLNSPNVQHRMVKKTDTDSNNEFAVHSPTEINSTDRPQNNNEKNQKSNYSPSYRTKRSRRRHDITERERKYNYNLNRPLRELEPIARAEEFDEIDEEQLAEMKTLLEARQVDLEAKKLAAEKRRNQIVYKTFDHIKNVSNFYISQHPSSPKKENCKSVQTDLTGEDISADVFDQNKEAKIRMIQAQLSEASQETKKLEMKAARYRSAVQKYRNEGVLIDFDVDIENYLDLQKEKEELKREVKLIRKRNIHIGLRTDELQDKIDQALRMRPILEAAQRKAFNAEKPEIRLIEKELEERSSKVQELKKKVKKAELKLERKKIILDELRQRKEKEYINKMIENLLLTRREKKWENIIDDKKTPFHQLRQNSIDFGFERNRLSKLLKLKYKELIYEEEKNSILSDYRTILQTLLGRS